MEIGYIYNIYIYSTSDLTFVARTPNYILNFPPSKWTTLSMSQIIFLVKLFQ